MVDKLIADTKALVVGWNLQRFLAPYRQFVHVAVYTPLKKVVYYNEATTHFASEHPTLFALGILLVIYIAAFCLIHVAYKLLSAIFGRTPMSEVKKSADHPMKRRTRTASGAMEATKARKASSDGKKSETQVRKRATETTRRKKSS